MGELNRFNLNDFMCDIFIETGTGEGVGVEYASKFNFKDIHTIEIIPQLFEHSKFLLNDNRVHYHLGNSIEILNRILPKILKKDRILFWLDAHFPGTDFGIGGNTYIFDDNNMPLKDELKAIKYCRDIFKDTFIIDDLRLYEDGNYQLGNIDIGKCKSSEFILDIFKDTHTIKRDYRDQGFLLIQPKE